MTPSASKFTPKSTADSPNQTLIVNGDRIEVPDGISVRGLIARLGLPEPGLAVAVSGEVRPVSRWDQPIQAGATIEILTAVQGG